MPQGVGADLIATMEGFDRRRLTSLPSNRKPRPQRARAAGHFSKSVIPVRDQNGLTILAEDEFIKPGTTLETPAGLNPSFGNDGADGL